MIEQLLAFVLPAAFALLPEEMQSLEATALLLAIGLQESRFQFRRQVGGPARSFWQFELGGLEGVLEHRATEPILEGIIRTLKYDTASNEELLAALEHNDVLAACCARCLLWTLPGGLPAADNAPAGWRMYVDAWRPGKPRVETWKENYTVAWQRVTATKGQTLKA